MALHVIVSSRERLPSAHTALGSEDLVESCMTTSDRYSFAWELRYSNFIQTQMKVHTLAEV